jgi:hypothetical protein
MNRILEDAKLVLFFPFIQIYNLYLYAQTQESLLAKIFTLVVFIPIFLITTTIWAAGWAFLLSFLLHLFLK